MKVEELTIKKINQGLKNKEFSAVDLTKEYFSKIKEKDKEISSFIVLTERLAEEQALKVDEKISLGKEISVLAGVPMAVKDNILIKGSKTTCASRMLENYNPPYEATCIKKLREEGAVFLGKTNLDEFAMGASTENSAFFPTKNPHDPERVPGGSSGGSAAAVAAGFCPFALGSDTGGSIRQPASFCGVVGLKPTYGAVSRYGLVAYGSSLDQIGPLAKNAEDAEIVFERISGKDDHDSTSLARKPSSSVPKKIDKMVIGVPKEYFQEGLDSGAREVIMRKIKEFEDLGAKIEEISLPHTKYAVSAYYLIVNSEASTNLARYDGIKYGLFEEGDNLKEVYSKTRGQGFGSEVKRRIMLGTYALSAGYYQAYYLKAQKTRTLIAQDFYKAFEKVDVIMAPVAPTPPFKLGEKITDPLAMYLCDVYTAPVSLAGLPSLSLPAGFLGKLPIGLQIIGKPFGEKTIFNIAKQAERQ